MKVIDISLTIDENLPVWPGDTRFKLSRRQTIDESDSNVSSLASSVHVGTHVDAPFHFVRGGATTETLVLETMIGPVQVVQLPDACNIISASDIEACGLEAGIQRVIFKTRNSALWIKREKEFKKDFVAIAPDGAEYLVNHGIRLVGVDYLSVASFDNPVPTHTILLKAGVVALEGLDLSQVQPGRYTLYCLPIKLGGSDGAPARVILMLD